MQNDNTVLIPNFTVESRTKALNAGVWGFVGLISMFTISVCVLTLHLALVSVFDVTSTFVSDNMTILIPGIVLIFAIVFGIGFYCFLSDLLTAYIIQPNRIIKGRITNKANRPNEKSLTLQAALTAYMAANLPDGSKVSGANGIRNLFGILELINWNMEPDFARQFFFTEMYSRKEYNHPQLIKENRYSYTYICGNKKVKIRKIYTGMDKEVITEKSVSILRRVVKKALLVFGAFSVISLTDFSLGLENSSNSIQNITQSYNQIEAALTEFGYTAEKRKNTSCQFEKVISTQRTSYVNYFFDSDATIRKVEFELYFDSSSDMVQQEIEYIFTSLNDGITKQQMEKFAQDTQSTIQGKYIYNKLQTDSYTIVLGTSDGHAYIHN